jgi:hypothetical protein
MPQGAWSDLRATLACPSSTEAAPGAESHPQHTVLPVAAAASKSAEATSSPFPHAADIAPSSLAAMVLGTQALPPRATGETGVVTSARAG